MNKTEKPKMTFAEACLAHGGVPHDPSQKFPADYAGLMGEMKSKYGLITLGNPKKSYIIEEDREARTHRILTRQALSDIYKPCPVIVESKDGRKRAVDAVDHYLRQKDRRYYSDYVFRPDWYGMFDNVFNVFQGLNVIDEPGPYEMWCEHIYEVICNGDDRAYEYFLAWCHDVITNFDLESKPGVSIAMRGPQGCGKGLAVDPLLRILAPYSLHVTHGDHVAGKFNKHLMSTILMFADEAFFAGSKQARSLIKGLISEKTLMIEIKGVDAFQSPNFIKMIVASNENWVVPAAWDDRRWLVLDCSGKKCRNFKYFERLAEFTRFNYHHIYHALKTTLRPKVNLRDAPTTGGLVRQKIESMPIQEQFYFEILKDGKLPRCRDLDLDADTISCRDFQTGFDTFAARSADRAHAKAQELGDMLKRCCPARKRMNKTVAKGKQEKCYVFPTLKESRELFNLAFRLEADSKHLDWDDSPNWEK